VKVDPSSINLVIYHGACYDGMGAAWAAWKLLGDLLYLSRSSIHLSINLFLSIYLLLSFLLCQSRFAKQMTVTALRIPAKLCSEFLKKFKEGYRKKNSIDEVH